MKTSCIGKQLLFSP